VWIPATASHVRSKRLTFIFVHFFSRLSRQGFSLSTSESFVAVPVIHVRSDIDHSASL